MRRLLAFVSLVLILLGLELSTQTLSMTVSRMSAGIEAALAGVEFYVPTARFFFGLMLVGAGLVLWAMLFWARRTRVSVGSVGSACPSCGSHTRRIKRKRWQRFVSALGGQRIARRKCETCGWIGLALRE